MGLRALHILFAGCVGAAACTPVSDGSAAEYLSLLAQQRCIDNSDTFEELIQCVPPNEEVPDLDEPFTVRTTKTSPLIGNVKFDCTTADKKVAKNSSDIIVFDPNADALYPGGIIRGNSIPSGHLTPVGLPRKPGNLVFSNITFNNSPPGIAVDDPNLATVTATIQSMISDTSNTGAKIFYDFYSGESIEEISFKLGINVNAFAGAVGADLDLEGQFTQKKTYASLKFVQNYYTVSYQPPQTPRAFFGDDVDLETFKLYVEPGNPLAYVSSVSYGRMLVMLVESSVDELNLKAAITAYLDVVIGRLEAGISVEYNKIMEESDITIFALGGAAADAIGVIKTANINQSMDIGDYILNGATFSPASPGVPISYQLRWLSNYEPARLSFIDDYSVRTCKPDDPTNLTEDWTPSTSGNRGQIARKDFALTSANGFVYAVGGANQSGTAIGSIEFAPVTVDGSFGAFNQIGSCSDSNYTTQAPCELEGNTWTNDGLEDSGGTSITRKGIGAFTHSGGIEFESANEFRRYTRLYVVGGKDAGDTISDAVRFTCLDSLTGQAVNCTIVDNVADTADPAASLWIDGPSLPKALRNSGVLKHGNTAYVIGGRRGGANHSSSVYYSGIDLAGDLGSWIATSALPVGRSHFGVAAYRDYLYVAGGISDGGRLSTVLYARINSDGSVGTWNEAKRKLRASGSSAALPVQEAQLVAFNGALYIFGGYTEDGPVNLSAYALIDETTGEPGTWEDLKYDIAVNRRAHQVLQYREHLFVLGGQRGNGLLFGSDDVYQLIQSKLRLTE